MPLIVMGIDVNFMARQFNEQSKALITGEVSTMAEPDVDEMNTTLRRRD